jgi:hypothetical protein
MARAQPGKNFDLSRPLAKKIVTAPGAGHMLGSAPDAGSTRHFELE